MSNVTVCVRFRPLSSRERKVHGDSVCIQCLDVESFIFKDEKEEDINFFFDRVFYQDSEQSNIYEFLAMPIVGDALRGINGTIITYGQTGAGKTYSMEGPNILDCDDHDRGLLQRVVDEIFECINSLTNKSVYTVKLSMVEIYMERVRDLFDLSKDNLQIKEGKQGIYISGATEISISNSSEALRCLSRGVANRAVGETQMNLASSRSHCLYIFSVQQESFIDERVKSGKLFLVDLAGSEKVEKTGAGGRVLDEAKTINKSLSALGNVINALTAGKTNHIPYRDSKLTRILQDALGGNSRTALLCCCSPSLSNASESLSTLRFGTRTKLIKTPLRANPVEEKEYSEQITACQANNELRDRILDKLRENLKEEDVELLEELFILEGVFFYPDSIEGIDSAYNDITIQTISSLHQAVKELKKSIEELLRKNDELKARLAAQLLVPDLGNAGENPSLFDKFTGIIRFLYSFISFPTILWR